jgi:hypothetical protein
MAICYSVTFCWGASSVARTHIVLLVADGVTRSEPSDQHGVSEVFIVQSHQSEIYNEVQLFSTPSDSELLILRFPILPFSDYRVYFPQLFCSLFRWSLILLSPVSVLR